MSLIKCSECGKEISDKAVTCPHCGSPVILMDTESQQDEAGNTRSAYAGKTAMDELAEDTASDTGKDDLTMKRKKIIKIAIVAIVGIAVLVVGIIMYQQYKEKQYIKNAYDYLESCRLTFNDSNSVTGMTEQIWYNCIWEKDNGKTDPYTKKSDGSFYDDFNDALTKWFESDKYISKVKKINSNYSNAQTLYNELTNPPLNMKNTWSAIQSLNRRIVSFKNAAINPQGSYNQYSSQVNKIYNKASDAYDKLEGLL